MPGPVHDPADAPRDIAPGAELHSSRRRLLLLKGIGRGGALLAGAVPIRTLAATPSITVNGKLCSISGVQSAVHSGVTDLPTCAGRSPSVYANIANWPSGDTTYTVDGISFGKNTKFDRVFGTSPLGNTGLLLILKQSPASDEAHWITALLNAIKPPNGYVFPYSPSEVLAFFRDPSKSEAALAFFRGYMETLA